MAALTFITGTDTGVGKTLLTGLLLEHLRQRGVQALAMKPFCSGGTEDVDFLDALQERELPSAELNPFYFPELLSPLAAARKRRRRILLDEVVEAIRRVASRCEHLLIEGSGGLMVPLGQGFEVLNLIGKLDCDVLVASANRLGTLNHTLLTVRALRSAENRRVKVVLMNTKALRIGPRTRDVSRNSNFRFLQALLAPVSVLGMPFLGPDPKQIQAVKKNQKKLKKTLAQILDFDIVSPTFFASLESRRKK